MSRLKEILLGPERRRLEEAERRLAAGLRAEQMAEELPEAIAIRGARDRRLATALTPTIETALGEAVRRNPNEIATAIFPVLGPAIRKAIAEAMAGLVRSINAAVEHSFTIRGLRWRLEAWRTGVPFAQIVLRHSLVYRVEQVFLIHAETGLLLAHVAPGDLAVADADLVAGMMTAIQDFAADSFAVEEKGGGLRTFSVGELTVQVERGPLAILAAVVRGQAPDSLATRLQNTLETVHLRFASLFANFGGDPKPFGATEPLLRDCLETVLATERAGRSGIWLRWAIPLALLIALGGWFLWRSGRRWQDAVQRVRAIPGIVLVDAARGWGRWRFTGLKDPIAADPKAVLAGAGVDTSRIEAAWRPYLSLEPDLVIERARQALATPSSVRLELRGDSLLASGRASIGWLEATRARDGFPAGIRGVDLSRVAPTLPDSLEPLRREIEERLIFFPIASARVGPGSFERLAALADLVTRLDGAVAADGYRVRIQLVGRTDASGSDSTNQALSRMRALAVQNGLVRLGLAPAMLEPVGIDGSSPLAGADPEDRAARNRTVAFLVLLVPDQPE